MDIFLLVVLILINGVFAMSEIAVVSSRKARLQNLADDGSLGAEAALSLHQEPSSFLSTIQVGITSVGILSGAIGEAALEKDRMRFQHAPMIVAVIAQQGEDAKIPASERFASACCVCFALLQAAQALGYGAQWLTGWPAYDPGILRTLGVGEDERIAGFIHLGTPKAEAPERDRPDPADLLTDLTL